MLGSHEPSSSAPSSPERPRRGVLSAEQQRRYGRYPGEPNQAQLDGYFHPNATDQDLVLSLTR